MPTVSAFGRRRVFLYREGQIDIFFPPHLVTPGPRHGRELSTPRSAGAYFGVCNTASCNVRGNIAARLVMGVGELSAGGMAKLRWRTGGTRSHWERTKCRRRGLLHGGVADQRKIVLLPHAISTGPRPWIGISASVVDFANDKYLKGTVSDPFLQCVFLSLRTRTVVFPLHTSQCLSFPPRTAVRLPLHRPSIALPSL
jgi:hypothetical protein